MPAQVNDHEVVLVPGSMTSSQSSLACFSFTAKINSLLFQREVHGVLGNSKNEKKWKFRFYSETERMLEYFSKFSFATQQAARRYQ